ncbi:hypothetical protein E2562_033694, partial [Oryza meyeriana var. granulata]
MSGYDRLRDLKAFDDTKAGVKGLVDAGVTAIPRIFHHKVVAQVSGRRGGGVLPGGQPRRAGAPPRGDAGGGAAIQQQPAAAEAEFYTRYLSRKVRFNSNFDLFESPAANWRDTLFVQAAPDPPRPEELPTAVRGVLPEYAGLVRRLSVS